MSRDRFKQIMFSPYFQSKHYEEHGGQFEKKVESFFIKTIKSIKSKFSKK